MALAAFNASPVAAVEPFERAYDPPVGSRWIIESETRGREMRPEGTATSLVKTRAELTVEQKTADGFRMSYINRGAIIEGNARDLPLRRAYMKAIESVTIRLTTDLAGKPLRIDNLDEARAAVRRAAENLSTQFDNGPAARALLDQLVAELTDLDDDQAASVYAGNLSLLSSAQSTGMKRGEVRLASKPVESPLGGDALKSNERFELIEANAATGRLKFVSATSLDPASLKDYMQSLARGLLAATVESVAAEQIDRLAASMTFSLDRRAEFEVTGGMTRRIVERSTTVIRGMEQNLTQAEERIITVTHAP
ncbi:MAG TPA: hypothetical protein VKT76_06790 [Bradyrhizobium sp.]|nr:hypothetical protein [Bradyrhizobium sp.]